MKSNKRKAMSNSITKLVWRSNSPNMYDKSNVKMIRHLKWSKCSNKNDFLYD